MYMIADVIYGFPITDDWLNKHDPKYFDEDSSVFNMEESDIIVTLYDGGGRSPRYLGIKIGEWDEATDYIIQEDFNEYNKKVTSKVKDEFNKLMTVFAAECPHLVKYIPKIGIYHILGTS